MATYSELQKQVEEQAAQIEALVGERETLKKKVNELTLMVARRKRTVAQRLADTIKLISEVNVSEYLTHAQRNGIDILIKTLAERLENELNSEDTILPPVVRVFTESPGNVDEIPF